MIQFDAISELNMDWTGSTNIVVFARYWVCQDYYAASVVWTEPRGGGRRLKSQIVFSDENAFRMDDEFSPRSRPLNTTYPKPVGERSPFRWVGGFYGSEEMRFAEADALARRVYVSDLGSAKNPKSGADGTIDVNVPRGPGGVTRKLARLKVHARDDRIESMELFDNQRQSLAKMRYEYEPGAGAARIRTLVAELPVRPQKLGGVSRTTTWADGTKTTYKIPDVNYVSHKGGRTCTVTYRDVTLGDTVLRLPVQVKVQRSDNKQVLRSARLMNFKRVDLDKKGVWEAAKAFGSLGSEHSTWSRLVNKFLLFEPRVGPPSVDPNDFTFARRLIAKYPVLERPPMSDKPNPVQVERQPPDLDSELGMQQELMRAEIRKREQAQRQEQIRQWREQTARMPKPKRMTVEPNDLRLIRQLSGHYDRMLSPPLTEEQRTELRTELRTKGAAPPTWEVPERLREVKELRDKLEKILRYHRVLPLLEDRAPEPNDSDCTLIRQLKGHYEKLELQQDQGLGGRLKALHALTRLDLMLKDYDGFEGLFRRYLQMLRDAELNQMYMVGGYRCIDDLIGAGQYERPTRLFGPWADRSAANNDADAVYRFCGSDLGAGGSPWAAVQLLDRFLKKPGLSPVQRYEGLALRAIALDKIDRLLADPNLDEDEALAAQAQWILQATKRAEIAKLVGPAVRQAVSAWESLGAARLTEAKPYSMENAAGHAMMSTGEVPAPTRLQETSARLNQIVAQRFGQKRPAPRPRETRRSAPTR